MSMTGEPLDITPDVVPAAVVAEPLRPPLHPGPPSGLRVVYAEIVELVAFPDE